MNIPQPDALNSKHCDLVGPDAKKIDDLSDDLASVRTLVAKPDAKKIDELSEKIDDLLWDSDSFAEERIRSRRCRMYV